MLHAHISHKIHSATSGTDENTFNVISLTLLIFLKGLFGISRIFGMKIFCNVYATGKKSVLLKIKRMGFFLQEKTFQQNNFLPFEIDLRFFHWSCL